MQRKRLVLAVVAVVSVLGCGGEGLEETGAPGETAQQQSELKRPRVPKLTAQDSGTTQRLQAISPVSARVVWASGVGGTFALTTNGGATWHSGVVPGAEALQFRDVEGVSEKVAYLMAAGSGEDSRIYKTEDGGRTWKEQFRNTDPAAFYDCFAFWTPERGITMSDAVEGRFPVIRTTDGEAWRDIGDNLPGAQTGEAAFAASGTCVAVQGKQRAWIATGGAEHARILATTDGGKTWASYATPTVQGTPSSGVLSVAFRDARHGILGAGELAAPTEFADTVARSSDGGKTWSLTSRPPFPGAIYGLAYADSKEAIDRRGGSSRFVPAVVATGPGGAAVTFNEGNSWTPLQGVDNYWAVAFADERTGWLVGTEGRILKIRF
ncbi:hypothetical protein FGE12_04100 [Aggregicoccus sp. 17bor-14]|nr:hypothetical protein [Simulacricoccus sp. 17bor-14]MRI87342.1 hypothetical protein [Aggregicoccus sp. 17bor-14]